MEQRTEQQRTRRVALMAVLRQVHAEDPKRSLTGTELARLAGVKTMHLNAALRVPLSTGEVHKTRHREDARVTLFRVEPFEPPRSPFQAMRHLDGNIDLYGLEALPDGGHRLQASDARRLFNDLLMTHGRIS